MRPFLHPALAVLALALLAGRAGAQRSAFDTPGQPLTGQTDRFSRDFNPAIGFVIDMVADWIDTESNVDDGFDIDLRKFELNTAAWIDPSAWAYAVIVADTEEIELEEAAVIYQGFDSNKTLRGGRFFVDFGKQMQAHVDQLRTIDRPGVLREYLGEELAGTGAQYDDWLIAGESTVVRYSIGFFADLASGVEGPDEDEGPVEVGSDERLDLDQFGLTARVTGFRDAGERGVLQLGASAVYVPDFELELESSGDSADELSTGVLGADLTYGWNSDTGVQTWTLGTEALYAFGDAGASIDDNLLPGDPSDDLLQIYDDGAFGYFAFADRAWTRYDSAGFQVSMYEVPTDDAPWRSEWDLYYTRRLSDFQRLRFGFTYVDEEDGDDAVRLALQYTVYAGTHSHPINF